MKASKNLKLKIAVTFVSFSTRKLIDFPPGNMTEAEPTSTFDSFIKSIKNNNNRRPLNLAKNNQSKKLSPRTLEILSVTVYGQAGLHFSFEGQTSANAGSPINKNYAPRTLVGIHAVMGPLKVQKEGPTWEDCLRDHSSSSALLV